MEGPRTATWLVKESFAGLASTLLQFSLFPLSVEESQGFMGDEDKGKTDEEGEKDCTQLEQGAMPGKTPDTAHL